MYSLLNSLLSDKKGGEIFSCFGIWHWCYIAIFAVIAVIALLYLKNKNKDTKEKATRLLIDLAFGLYIADFFLMPFAYQEIDIEKLPFHICTAMCVMCFFSQHNRFFAKFRLQLALLGFLSNLIYLIYPAGVMWYQVHPLSYRVVQTLTFHGLMTVYGLLVLTFNREEMRWRKCYQDLTIIISMTLWALLGNLLYNGESADYSHFFNWFFVVRDPFYILPAAIAPFIMPFLNIAAFFAVEMLIYLICFGLQKLTVNNIQTIKENLYEK